MLYTLTIRQTLKKETIEIIVASGRDFDNLVNILCESRLVDKFTVNFASGLLTPEYFARQQANYSKWTTELFPKGNKS